MQLLFTRMSHRWSRWLGFTRLRHEQAVAARHSPTGAASSFILFLFGCFWFQKTFQKTAFSRLVKRINKTECKLGKYMRFCVYVCPLNKCKSTLEPRNEFVCVFVYLLVCLIVFLHLCVLLVHTFKHFPLEVSGGTEVV